MRGKPKDGSKNPGGRPKRQLSEKQVWKLAKVGLIHSEIAAVLSCSLSTLERYSNAIKDGHEHMRSSLRRKQFQVAMSGNVGMLIWLGKQHLGQKEKHEHGGPDGGAIPVNLEGLEEAIKSAISA